ncbi:MAG: hypothetical protein F6K28_35130 [Microcoleus sp. SIO2G3]|nr:hypothetical protein [Microcoleus sp. SIO2G3]
MIKGAIALVLILLTLLIGGEPLPSANSIAFMLLLLSGAIAIGFGILAALAQTSGAVLSRAALAQTTVSPLWATLLRLSAGVLVLLPLTAFSRQKLGFQETVPIFSTFIKPVAPPTVKIALISIRAGLGRCTR